MKVLIIVLIAISFSDAFAQEKNIKDFEVREKPLDNKESVFQSELSDLQKNFISKTGLVLGDYSLTKDSSKDCWDGQVELLDLGDELSLILGAKTLVTAIGKGKTSEKENKCTFITESSFSMGLIKEMREANCVNGTTVVTTEVKISKTNISYVRELLFDGKQTNKFKCNLTMDKGQNKK